MAPEHHSLTGCQDLGASFSLHRCKELELESRDVLAAAIQELGLKRFRLMSYWNIHEAERGNYNFTELDWQLDLLAEHGCRASLCLGKRQPRWPECHMPDWAANLPADQWYEALFHYIEAVVRRYRDHPALTSWQLENEALLKKFGYCPDGDYSHDRLQHEFQLVKNLDANHPVIMTLSDSWGLPWYRPKPDRYAMSLYRQTINKKGQFVYSRRGAWFYKIRAYLIRTLKKRPVFIHELQAEPWVKQAIMLVPLKEQLQLMDAAQLRKNIMFARQTSLYPIDLWGLEWWYWLRAKHGQPAIWQAVQSLNS